MATKKRAAKRRPGRPRPANLLSSEFERLAKALEEHNALERHKEARERQKAFVAKVLGTPRSSNVVGVATGSGSIRKTSPLTVDEYRRVILDHENRSRADWSAPRQARTLTTELGRHISKDQVQRVRKELGLVKKRSRPPE